MQRRREEDFVVVHHTVCCDSKTSLNTFISWVPLTWRNYLQSVAVYKTEIIFCERPSTINFCNHLNACNKPSVVKSKQGVYKTGNPGKDRKCKDNGKVREFCRRKL